jgi:hypothetical protein
MRADGGWLESCAIIMQRREEARSASDGRRSMAEPAAKATNVYQTVARVKWRVARRVGPVVPLLRRRTPTPVISHDAMLPPARMTT